jgi:signal transduction histidine kinase
MSPETPHVAGDGPGYGLTGMRERAELLGGELTTARTRGGFRVELRVPA